MVVMVMVMVMVMVSIAQEPRAPLLREESRCPGHHPLCPPRRQFNVYATFEVVYATRLKSEDEAHMRLVGSNRIEGVVFRDLEYSGRRCPGLVLDA
eukprot:4573088-Pyramimonas_sp.AAC.2